MPGENAPHAILPTEEHDEATKKVRLPSFRTLLESLSSSCTLRYRLSESPDIGNFPIRASSSHRTLSPSISTSTEEPALSGTHTDTDSDEIETNRDENIDQTTNQVARWIEEYHATSYDSPNGSSSPSFSDPYDRYDAASPPNQTASEIEASEDLTTKYSATLAHHAISPGGQFQRGGPFAANTLSSVHNVGHPKAPGTLRYTAHSKSYAPTSHQAKTPTTLPEPSQDDRSRSFAVAVVPSVRSPSPQTLPPEPRSGLALSSTTKVRELAPVPCACAMCQRSGNPMADQRVNTTGTLTVATHSVPPERPTHNQKPSSDDGTRSQSKSGCSAAVTTSGAPAYEVVVLDLAPTSAFASEVAPRWRPPRVADPDQFNVFRAGGFKPSVWQEYVPPGHQRDQQDRPKPRGAKRQRPTESPPAARKKKLNSRNSMSNSSKKQVSADKTKEIEALSATEHQEHADRARLVPAADNVNPSLRTEAAMPQERNDDLEANHTRAKNLSGLPWYAIPRSSDVYMKVDSEPVANDENKAAKSAAGFGPSARGTSEEQVTTDESSRGQQAAGVQLEDAPENAPGRETGDDESRTESDETSNGLPWYARPRPSDIYISVG